MPLVKIILTEINLENQKFHSIFLNFNHENSFQKFAFFIKIPSNISQILSSLIDNNKSTFLPLPEKPATLDSTKMTFADLKRCQFHPHVSGSCLNETIISARNNLLNSLILDLLCLLLGSRKSNCIDFDGLDRQPRFFFDTPILWLRLQDFCPMEKRFIFTFAYEKILEGGFVREGSDRHKHRFCLNRELLKTSGWEWDHTHQKNYKVESKFSTFPFNNSIPF